jgi:hypothetical protein
MPYSDTPEQASTIDWSGSKLVVKAFADTGKAPTLVQCAGDVIAGGQAC